MTTAITAEKSDIVRGNKCWLNSSVAYKFSLPGNVPEV